MLSELPEALDMVLSSAPGREKHSRSESTHGVGQGREAEPSVPLMTSAADRPDASAADRPTA